LKFDEFLKLQIDRAYNFYQRVAPFNGFSEPVFAIYPIKEGDIKKNP